MLEKTVSKRVTESYKYSFVGPFEVFMDVKNISSVLRKTKYLSVTRNQDKESLQEFSETMDTLEAEEVVLEQQRGELQVKRNKIEENKTELADERKNLNAQKSEQNNLLAESQRRKTTYQAQLSKINKEMAQLDDQISDIVVKLYAQGMLKNGTKVSAGQYIGFQGHTGCSYGSHLHFDIRNSSDTRLNPSTYLKGGIEWQSVSSKIYQSPLDGAILTQTYSSRHRAWDMRSSTRGNQNWETYTIPKGICSDVDYYIKVYGPTAYLVGEGAPVKAVAKGTVYYGTIIPNGVNGAKYPAKYALLIHNDGNKSFYLHLQ
ncbi:MAG: peptidoglycan DD-metalloendopeptidase family protein [Candidatus Dojkabacteria bacterium]